MIQSIQSSLLKRLPFICLLIALACSSLAQAQPRRGGLVVSDVVLLGDRGLEYVEKFEEVNVYFRIQNCSNREMTNLTVKFETGENTIRRSMNPVRAIQDLQPGDSEIVMIRVTSELRAEYLSILLTVEEGEIAHRGSFEFFFNTDYNHSLEMIGGDCRNPFKTLIAPGAITSRDRLNSARLTYGGLAFLSLGTGAYFYYSSDQLFSEYQAEASPRASELHDRIAKQDIIWQAAFAVSVPLIIMTGVRHFQHKRSSSNVAIGAVPIREGFALTLRIDL